MRRLLISSLIAAIAAAPAMANEYADACRDYAAANGTDDAGCDCLGDAAAADPDLAAAIMAIEGPADLEAADPATREAIAACFPS